MLSLWAGTGGEGARFWLAVLTDAPLDEGAGQGQAEAAISAAMAARSCWPVVSDTLSMVGRGSVILALNFSINYCMNSEAAGYIGS